VPRRDVTVGERPFIDLTSGYIQRSLATLPKQGDRPPWRLYQNWFRDILALRFGALEDGTMEFARAGASATGETPAAERSLSVAA
jgi:hypothetical protein